MSPGARRAEVRRLWKGRPRSRLVRCSMVAALVLLGLSVASGQVAFAELWNPRRWSNLRRFVGQELVPRPMVDAEARIEAGLRWAVEIWSQHGAEALATTLSIAVVSITLAAVGGVVLALFGARTLARVDPFVLSERPARFSGLGLLAACTRVGCTLLRAIPEYVWAFLFLAMLGANAWPAIVALVLHNAGILGRLGAETIEDTDPQLLRSLRMLGARRRGLALFGLWPSAATRYLLFVFYRFETCVREATVLGLLGISSLGYWVQETRGRQHYDEMVLYIALGAALVLAADLASVLLRRWARRAA